MVTLMRVCGQLFWVVLCVYPLDSFAVDIRRIDQAVGLRVFDGDSVKHIAASVANPSLVLVSSDQGEISLWDQKSLSMQWRFYAGTEETRAEFLPDGQLFVVVQDCFFTLYRVSDGMPLQAIDLSIKPGDESSIPDGCSINHDTMSRVLFTQSGSVAYVAQVDRVVEVDMLTGRVSRIFPGHVADRFWGIEDIRLSDAEDFLYVTDGLAYFSFNLASGEQVLRHAHSDIDGLPTQGVQSTALSRDGLYSIYAADIYIYLVDNVREQIERRQMVAADRITTLSISDDLTRYMIAAADGTSRFYDIATGTEQMRLDDTRSSARPWHLALAAPTSNELVYSGDSDGFVWLWYR